jgi:peptidoglycan/LPS O-acetylase OafA/YrhL
MATPIAIAESPLSSSLQERKDVSTGTSDSAEMGRMHELDGLRALAALMVIVHHTIPHNVILRVVDLGASAVWLFFVLSGFLITSILIQNRLTAERSGSRRMDVMRSFYARRFLRIMPLYYLIVFASFAADLPGARRYISWDLTYSSNLLRSFAPDVTVAQHHFWSLCVEEQFYFIWPAIVLLTPWPWLVGLTQAMIALGPLSRLAFAVAMPKLDAWYIATPSCLDCLGFGALLALDRLRGRPCVRVPVGVGAALVISCWALEFFQIGWRLRIPLRPLGYAIVYTWLVGRASGGFKGVGRRFLVCQPLVYLGCISYGLYVYHEALPGFLTRWGMPLPDRSIARFMFVLTLSMAIASLSWFGLERPLNNLKRYFPYLPAQRVDGKGHFDRMPNP